MQKPPFRKRELNENVLIGLAFHKRQIWLHANVIVLFLSLCSETRMRWVRFERKQACGLCREEFKRVFFFFSWRQMCLPFQNTGQSFGLSFFLHYECLLKLFHKSCPELNKNAVAYMLNYRPTYSLFFKLNTYMQDVVVQIIIILFCSLIQFRQTERIW